MNETEKIILRTLADDVDFDAVKLGLADFEWPGDFAAVVDELEREGTSDD